MELFSGTKSISKVARSLGWETCSLDISPKYSPDLCMDILKFDETQYSRNRFDFVWSSPDCRAYSSARTNATVDRETAMQQSDQLVAKTIQIINYFAAPYCVENPAFSRLWQRKVATGLLAISVITSYCSFEYAYRKNIRLASNFPLVLHTSPGKGLCPQMTGAQHKQLAQRGGVGLSNGIKLKMNCIEFRKLWSRRSFDN